MVLKSLQTALKKQNKTLQSAYVGYSFHTILLANKFIQQSHPMPGVSMADGFALIYSKCLFLGSDADICKRPS